MESCSPVKYFLAGVVRRHGGLESLWLPLILATWFAIPASAQMLLKPSQPGETVNLMPSDLTVLEAGQERKDLPCNVTQRKPDLGFDLRFHAGFEVNIPIQELAGEGQLLTVVFRVTPQGGDDRSANFVEHFTVPPIGDEAKGDALLQGVIDLGEGSYHVDWLMRDRTERVCATSWDVEASLPSKDKPISLFLSKNRVEQTRLEPFFNEPATEEPRSNQDNLNVKLLVNFAPQKTVSAALQRSDTGLGQHPEDHPA